MTSNKYHPDAEFIPIHIGLTKCASTYLQHCVFPVLFPYQMDGKRQSLKATPSDRQRIFSGSWPAYTLFSWEGFSASQSGRAGDSWSHFESFINLTNSLPYPVRALIILRNHESWLKSEYIDRLKKNKPTSGFEDFCYSAFSEDDLNWAKRLKMLKQANVLTYCLTTEDLKQEPQNSIEKISLFWEVEDHFNYENVLKLMKKKTARKNQNPKNYPALILGRTFKQLQDISKLTLRKKPPRSWQDILILWANNFFKRSPKISESLVVPHDLTLKFHKDWQIAMQLKKQINVEALSSVCIEYQTKRDDSDSK